MQSKLIERNERIAELKSMIDVRERANQQLNDELNAMRQRLMPEGMEWPRFEDGRQVKFRDEGVDVHGELRVHQRRNGRHVVGERPRAD